jgi:hypothetical protein
MLVSDEDIIDQIGSAVELTCYGLTRTDAVFGR